MVELYCVDALCKLIKEALEDIRLHKPPRQTEERPGSLYEEETPEYEDDPEDEIEIKVFNGWLPSKNFDNDADYPFVTVRPSNATVHNGATDLTIEIIVGTFARDDLAYQDTMNVVHRLMMRIAQLENGILDRKYERMGDMKWELPFEQKEPYYMAIISTSWRIYTSQYESSNV